jgi:hypothetical protein
MNRMLLPFPFAGGSPRLRPASRRARATSAAAGCGRTRADRPRRTPSARPPASRCAGIH